jgi:hypothetical protein
MIKSVICLIFLCSLFACKEAGKNKESKKKVAEELPLAKNDTFINNYDYELNNIDLKPPYGFDFDTIKVFVKKSLTGKYLIIPRIKNINDSTIEKRLRKGILEIVSSFLKYNDFLNKENKREIIEGRIHFTPSNIYTSTSLISYCFEICYSDSFLMRPYCKYDCINYNIKADNIIKFSNFFNIDSGEDSLYFKKIISSSVREGDAFSQINLDDKLDFSMNDEYIFFYFDQYELMAPFNIAGGVKKKYLERFIKQEYK